MSPNPLPRCPHCARSATIAAYHGGYEWVHSCLGGVPVYSGGYVSAETAWQAWQAWCATQRAGGTQDA